MKNLILSGLLCAAGTSQAANFYAVDITFKSIEYFHVDYGKASIPLDDSKLTLTYSDAGFCRATDGDDEYECKYYGDGLIDLAKPFNEFFVSNMAYIEDLEKVLNQVEVDLLGHGAFSMSFKKSGSIEIDERSSPSTMTIHYTVSKERTLN